MGRAARAQQVVAAVAMLVLAVGCSTGTDEAEPSPERPTSAAPSGPSTLSPTEPTSDAPEPSAPTTSEPSGSTSSTGFSCDAADAEVEVVGLSNGGGALSTTPIELRTAQDITRFVDGLNPRVHDQALAAIGTVPSAGTDCTPVRLASVVAISCDEPGVDLAPVDSGWRFTVSPGKQTQQCLVPISWLALVTVPEGSPGS